MGINLGKVPDIWKPTMNLRWEITTCIIEYHPFLIRKKVEEQSIYTLQQLWIDNKGNEEWRDLDIVNKK